MENQNAITDSLADQNNGGADQGGANQGDVKQGAADQGGTENWKDKYLTDDIKNHEIFNNVADIPSLAKLAIDNREFARSRFPLPKEGDEQSFNDFASRLRPEAADDYVLSVPEGQDDSFANAMKPVLHSAGLHPKQAQLLNDGWNQYQADLESRNQQAASDEIKAIELNIGTSAFNQRKAAVQQMLQDAGVDIDDLGPAFQQIAGAGKGVEALFKLAEKTGQLGKVDGGTANAHYGNMSADDIGNMIESKMNDPDFRAKSQIKGSPEQKEWDQLNAALAKAKIRG